MRGVWRFVSFWVSLTFVLVFSFRASMAEDGRKTPPPNTIEGDFGNISTINSFVPPPPPPPLPVPKSNMSHIKPSIAVIVGVLTTMFSITFLLLLYAKHCKRSTGVGAFIGNPNSRAPTSSAIRKNSGIDRSVIESLPIFRFGSLRGQKEGLECAVCLTRFQTTEVLRLLPKCKHAFHIECVDTWLDAHSTCPLCRYRVDPEDVLLVVDTKDLEESEAASDERRASEADTENVNRSESNQNPASEISGWFRRVSGRHSSAGEKASPFLQIVVQRPGQSGAQDQPGSSSSSSRRSLDSAMLKKKNESSVSVGCFDRGYRKDGLLPTEAQNNEHRFEHRIIVSSARSGGMLPQRWSDMHPSDLLFLRSEMIMTNIGRHSSSSSRPSISLKHQRQQQRDGEGSAGVTMEGEVIDSNRWDGRNVINSRSVSEITGLSRFSDTSSRLQYLNHHRGQLRRGREAAGAGVVKRWLAWVANHHSQSSSQASVRHRSTGCVV